MDYEYQQEAETPSRPPQFKESNCGYRCGWGCCEPLGEDSEGSESDATSTAVGSGYETEARGQMLLHEDVEASRPVNLALVGEVEGETRPIAVNDIEDSQHVTLHMISGDVSYTFSQSNRDYDGSLDHMENEASNGAYPNAASDNRRIVPSPFPGWDTGMTARMENDEADRCPREHHFLKRPLRLSPQYEHCRGNSGSHMVVPDELMLFESVERHWRRLIRELDHVY